MPAPLSVREYAAFRYMTRFSCIGGACEETCCGNGWDIAIDEEHHHALRKAMARTEADRAEFSAAIAPPPGQRDSRHYSLIRLGPTGGCPFLDAERLCSAQRRFGADVLSNTCAVFPRAISLVGDRVEVAGTVSCPEVARLLLLAGDALDLVPIDKATLPRSRVSNHQPLEGADAYASAFHAVRDSVVRLLSVPAYSVATRLFFVAYLGHRTSAFFRKGGSPLDLPKLGPEIGRLERADVQRELAEQFASLEIPSALGAAIVMHVLESRAKDSRASTFFSLVAEVLASYAGANAGVRLAPGDPLGYEVEPARLWEAYLERKAAWSGSGPIAERLDRIFGNYCASHWQREWYTASDDLLAHTHGLLLRVAVVRFLLLGHPRLRAAAAISDEAERLRALDATAVEVFYKFSRAIEHTPEFLQRIERSMREQGMHTLAHAVFLAKL